MPTLVVTNELLKSIESFSQKLCELYLGPPATYRLSIDTQNLATVDHIFDQLIAQYGIRPVEFEYQLRRPYLAQNDNLRPSLSHRQ